MSRFARKITGGSMMAIQLAGRALGGRAAGEVTKFWTGKLDRFEFIAVGGGGNGAGGNYTNNQIGGGGGGGGLAAGFINNPVTGTITIGAAVNNTSCFGESGLAGQTGDGVNQPQYMYTAQGGGRTTSGGANGGNGGKAGAVGIAGPTSAITGTTTNYGGGGGGGGNGVVAGGAGGGGNGNVSGAAATVNTGGGGGGGWFGTGGAGGSGIVIIKYPAEFPQLSSIAAGLTYTVQLLNGFWIYRFTAGTGTVQI